MSQYKIRKSIVLSKDEVIAQLKPIYISSGVELIKDVINGRALFKDLERLNLEGKSVEELGINWCELVSESFFAENPEIDDVLMKSPVNELKIWLASRDDWETEEDKKEIGTHKGW